MSAMRRRGPMLCGVLVLVWVWMVMPWGAAIAQSNFSTPAFTIVNFYTAWDNDWVLVQPDVPVENPDGCSLTDLYTTVRPPSVGSLGRSLRNSVLLSAFLTDRRVILVLDGCGGTGRPSIKAVVVKSQ